MRHTPAEGRGARGRRNTHTHARARSRPDADRFGVVLGQDDFAANEETGAVRDQRNASACTGHRPNGLRL